MKYVITEQQLGDLAYRLVLDKLNDMDFKFKKYKEFSFFPKGTHDADNGIESDYVVGEGYHILIGHSLYRSVRDLFGLTDNETDDAFRRAFNEKGIKKIAFINSLDFSEHQYVFDRNESLIKESKLENSIVDYLDEMFDVDNIHYTVPYEYNDETGEEGDDNTRMEFYIGDYENDDTCFRWYSCDYFTPFSQAREICPTVSLEYKYENILNGYFGNKWKEPFKKWFIHHFDLPVKTIDN
jgi:hypothetical protein